MDANSVVQVSSDIVETTLLAGLYETQHSVLQKIWKLGELSLEIKKYLDYEYEL